MKTKQDLEHQIAMLMRALESGKADVVDYENDLATAQKQLEDINKPELTPLQFDKIQEAVEEGVGNFSFDEQDNYDKEFGMEYDGKVYLESIDLTCSYELVEKIVEQVHKLFTEAECPEDDDSQLNTQTVAEKVI
jgi:hypothetical protein